MKTSILFFGLIFLQIFQLMAQSPEKVYGIAKQQKSIDWYAKQALLWKIEIEKNPLNASAWEYYYRSNRNIAACSGKDEPIVDGMTDSLQGIITKMGQAIPETFEYNYMLYYNGIYGDNREKYFGNLMKAYSIDPTRTEIYPDMVVFAESHSNKQQKSEYLNKWFNLNEMSPGILNWNYNLLMSVAKDGVLITNGDNDTFPAWMLQEVKNLRTDIKVINISLFLLDDYRKALCVELGIPYLEIDYTKVESTEILNQIIGEFLAKNITKRPLYFAESCDPAYYKTFEDSMYLEGLAFRFSPKKYDNVVVLKKNMEEKFLLDYLQINFTNDLSKKILENCNVNYITPMLLLYDYYVAHKQKEKAGKYKSLVLSIAETTSMKPAIENYFKESK